MNSTPMNDYDDTFYREATLDDITSFEGCCMYKGRSCSSHVRVITKAREWEIVALDWAAIRKTLTKSSQHRHEYFAYIMF